MPYNSVMDVFVLWYAKVDEETIRVGVSLDWRCEAVQNAQLEGGQSERDAVQLHDELSEGAPRTPFVIGEKTPMHC